MLTGSAVYINTLLDRTSPLYNVTLDGTTKSIDGFREVGPSLCTTLFSQEGLDERTEHEISVLVVVFSPSLNETMQNEYGTFSEALLLNNIMCVLQGILYSIQPLIIFQGNNI